MAKIIHSFKFGIAGIVSTFKSEANMRWHLLAAILVVASGCVFDLSQVEWALIAGCIGVVLALECLNTAIEHLADRITLEQDPLIGMAKDASAGAVLIISAASAVIGGVIFLPKLMETLG